MLRFASLVLLFLFSVIVGQPAEASDNLLYRMTAAGTAHTNSTTETVLASYAFPAYAFQPGKVYHLHAAAIATATNSTDTLTVVVRLGPTTLTGTTIGTTGAVDVSDNNVVVVDLYLTVRDADSSSTVMVTGLATILGAEGTVTARAVFEQVTSLDWAVVQYLELTGDWSVASASDSCRADQFILTEHV